MAKYPNFLKNKKDLTPDGGIVSDLMTGGQLGYGYKTAGFDAATPLALPPAFIVVIQTPTMWDNLNDNGVLRQTVKSLFETHAKAVTGIDVNYTLENQGQPVGHDSQELKVPTRSTRAPVDPNFTWSEVTGNLVWRIMHRWIWDISDPDTGTAFEHEGASVAETALNTYTMSSYALTFAVIQYDKTMHPDRLLDGSIITNVYPTTTGEFGMERTEGTTKVPERAIAFTGYIIHNERTKEIARQIANVLKLRGETYKYARSPLNDGPDMGSLGVTERQDPVNPLLNSAEGHRGLVDNITLTGEEYKEWNISGPGFVQNTQANAGGEGNFA